MSDARIRSLEREALNDPHALDLFIVELGRSGGGPLASPAMKDFDGYVARRLFEARRDGSEEHRDFALARRLLARFLHKHRVTNVSQSQVCVGRLLKNRCTAGSHSGCLCETLQDHWNVDHADMWLRNGNVVAVTSQPYTNHHEAEASVEAFAENGLDIVNLGVASSWYSPGHSTVLVVTASKKIRGVEIVEITRAPGEKNPLSITLSVDDRTVSLNRISGRTLLSWPLISRRLFLLDIDAGLLPSPDALTQGEWRALVGEAMSRHRVIQ